MAVVELLRDLPLSASVQQLVSEGEITDDDDHGATQSFRRQLANNYATNNGTESSSIGSSNA
jgi:hypothetical protein